MTVLKDSYKDESWDGTSEGLSALISDEEEWSCLKDNNTR
jgi:hypothetical protein